MEDEKKEEAGAQIQPRKSVSGKLIPGTTLTHCEVENFVTDEAEIEEASIPKSWTNCDARSFHTRIGPDYGVHGKKAASKSALYEIFAIDGFRMAKKVPNVGQFFEMPVLPPIKGNSKLPPLLVINAMVPNYGPPVFGDVNDGDGFCLVMFAKISDPVRELLESGGSSPPSKLFEEFIINSGSDDSVYRDACKVICRCMNNKSAKYGMVAKRLVKMYNSTPFLARTSTTFYHDPGVSFSIDIDAHVFGKPARKGLNIMIDYFDSLVVDWGIVIEGRTNEHLPEQILCCGRLSKTGAENAAKWPFGDD